eukprot:TRINITY_DN18864_c0_g1_i1.p1 TRINITY_DN18864_c0_g1~~TRINITY_DN18864_c0_g1_i1.p1  ORF type:complete len:142 (-),score=13.65 TRINITY_DN18864_c0_g1_i1:104-529(-)
MPLTKYYCEHCQRSFNDSPRGRRRHFASDRHIALVRLHRETWARLPPPTAPRVRTEPCVALMTTGVCDHGDECKYSHAFHVLEKFCSGEKKQRPEEATKAAQQTRAPPQLPPALEAISDSLPPSLMPPPPGGYKFVGAASW